LRLLRALTLTLPLLAASLALPAERARAEGSGAEPAGATRTATARMPKGLAGVGLTTEEVSRAVDRGATYLLANGVEAGSRPELLSWLALRHAGRIDGDAARRAAALAACDRQGSGVDGFTTYQAALALLVIEALDPAGRRAKALSLAHWLVENQAPGGGWHYGRPLPEPPSPEDGSPAPPRPAPTTRTAAGRTEIVRAGLIEDLADDADLSCTQFALLGLSAAARMGLDAPRSLWERAERYARSLCGEEGGFGYTSVEDPRGSMTAGGVACLSLTAQALGRPSGSAGMRADADAGRALDWLATRFALDRNPGHDDNQFYWLYGLERVGDLLVTEFLGEHEWYPLGARYLVDKQRADGSWCQEAGADERSGEPIVCDTAFAVLFLRRATLPAQARESGGATLGAPPQAPQPPTATAAASPAASRPPPPPPPERPPAPGMLETVVARDAPGAALLFILDCSGSMNQAIGGRDKFDVARAAVSASLAKAPVGTLVGLRCYGHRFTPMHQDADQDSELVIPLAPLDRDSFTRRLDALRARGKTPIALSIERAAAEEVSELAAGASLTVVLLTDGRETDKGRSPAAAARALASARTDITVAVHVVGFDLADDAAAHKELTGVATAGGGRYVRADDARALADALARGAASAAGPAATAFVVLDAEGREVARGVAGESRSLPAGAYRVALPGGDGERACAIEVRPGERVRVRLAPGRAPEID